MVSYPPQGVIPRGVREETASYIIFKVGTTYYAKNGETGEIEFSGTDASTVIQSALNALPAEGGRIFIKAGTYVISTPISVPDNTEVCGEGPSTILKAVDDAPFQKTAQGVIMNAGTIGELQNRNITFRNFQVDGNKANQPVGAFECVVMRFTENFFIENVWAHDSPEIGFSIGSKPGRRHWGALVNCFAWDNASDGLQHDRAGIVEVIGGAYFENGSAGVQKIQSVDETIDIQAIKLHGVFLYKNTGAGFEALKPTTPAPENVVIEGCFITENGNDGIYIVSGKHITIKGNIVTKNQYCGIRVWNCYDVAVLNNVCMNSFSILCIRFFSFERDLVLR